LRQCARGRRRDSICEPRLRRPVLIRLSTGRLEGRPWPAAPRITPKRRRLHWG
jgi:hypothetical protein